MLKSFYTKFCPLFVNITFKNKNKRYITDWKLSFEYYALNFYFLLNDVSSWTDYK